VAVVTPGHEISGTVAAFGGQAPGWRVGEDMVLHGGVPCGTCRACQRVRDVNSCQASQIMGLHRDGPVGHHHALGQHTAQIGSAGSGHGTSSDRGLTGAVGRARLGMDTDLTS
jgi:D-arabinose 1-dehydrogenase-like Zn-dependent alcohol dehydrogenase